MNKNDFQRCIYELLGDCSEKTTGAWISFAEECIGSKQYAHFIERPKEQAVASWLNYQYAELYFIKKEFGTDIANKIFNMADHPNHPHCLYPYEMREAAKYFKQDYTVEQIVELSVVKGYLDSNRKPRTMNDVQRDIAKQQNRDSQGR